MKVSVLFLIVVAVVLFLIGFIVFSLQPAGPSYNLTTFLCSKASGFSIVEDTLKSSDNRSCNYTFTGIDQSKIYFVSTGSTEKPLKAFLPSKKIQLDEGCPFISESTKPTIFVIGTANDVYSCHNELGQ